MEEQYDLPHTFADETDPTPSETEFEGASLDPETEIEMSVSTAEEDSSPSRELTADAAEPDVAEEIVDDSDAATFQAEAAALKSEKKAEPKMAAGPEDVTVIPDRVYFRIGDVAEITGIKPYVLRFWEKEFEIIHPVKNASGQRIYRKSDVEAVLLIKRLLYLERFSIEGAKKRIRELRKQRELGTAKRKRGDLDEAKLNSLFRIRRGLSDLAEYAASFDPHKN